MNWSKRPLALALALTGLFAVHFAGRAQEFRVSASATPTSILVNDPVLFLINVTNATGLDLATVFVTNAISSDAIVDFNRTTNSLGGPPTASNRHIVFQINNMFVNEVARLSLTLLPVSVGPFTNDIIVTAFGLTNLTTFTRVIIQVTPPSADLAVGLTSAASGVIAGGSTSIGLTVTNLGVGAATNVVATATLPASFGLLSLTPTNAITAFTNGVLTWTLGTLTNGAMAQLLASVRPTNGGTFNLIASVGASTTDPNPTNNTVTNSMTVDEVVSTNLVITGITPQLFNPQNGLMEEEVTVRNNGTNNVPAVRLLVGGLGTNVLYNAVGTNNGLPFVQYNATLAVNASVNLSLQYFVRTRTPLTNLTRTAVGVTFTNSPVTNTSFPDITKVVAVPAGLLIEFQSIPGRSYTILYANNLSFTNALAAQPAIIAPADRVQWIDNGPPNTVSEPASVGSRFYRVMLNP